MKLVYPPFEEGVTQLRRAPRIGVCAGDGEVQAQDARRGRGASRRALSLSFLFLSHRGGYAGAATGPLLNQRTPEMRGIKRFRGGLGRGYSGAVQAKKISGAALCICVLDKSQRRLAIT